MAEPFKVLEDAGVRREDISVKFGKDQFGDYAHVTATADLNGVQVSMQSAQTTVISAVAQCLVQLNEAKGILLAIAV